MSEPGDGRVVRDGQVYLNRAAIASLTGMAPQSQRNLYGERAKNGHPEGIKVGRALYFPEQEILEFYRERMATFRGRLTEVDRSGGPDDLVSADEAARVLGQRPSTIRAYLARDREYFPEADEQELLPAGGVRRRWRRQTLWDFADGRTGRGRGGATAAPAG